MKNIFAVTTNTYHGFTLDQALQGIAKAGFKYVEFTGVRGWTEHVDAKMNNAQIQKILHACKVNGLEPIGLSGHCNLTDGERINDFLDNIELAHRLRCKYIISSIGEAHFAHDEVDNEEVLLRNLALAAKKCDEYGMTLALEVHGQHGTGAIIADIVRKSGSKALGVNYDTANVIFYGKTLPEDDLPACVDDVKYMHIKDKAGEYGEWNFPALGKGFVDFKKVLGILEKHGNECPVSLEIEFTQQGPADLDEVDRAVRDSYDYLASIAAL